MADGPEIVPQPGGSVEPIRRPAPGTRSAAEIRADIQREREQLGHSVDALRGRVGELTNWRRQVHEHRRELAIGAAVVGFAVGVMAMRRRR